MARAVGQGGQRPGWSVPGLRLAEGACVVRRAAVSAEDVVERSRTSAEMRRAEGSPLPNPARTGSGSLDQTRCRTAAWLGGGRRRDGAGVVVSMLAAGAGRAVSSGRPLEHEGARPGCPDAGMERTRGKAEIAVDLGEPVECRSCGFGLGADRRAGRGEGAARGRGGQVPRAGTRRGAPRRAGGTVVRDESAGIEQMEARLLPARSVQSSSSSSRSHARVSTPPDTPAAWS